MTTKKRLNYEEVKEYIEKNGFKLLSREYLGTRKPIKLKCKNGHKWSIRFDSFRKNPECPYCSGRKLNYNIVKQNIEREGYKLISEEYKNTHSKLTLKCPNDHKFSIQYANFQQGQRCPKCAGIMKYSYDEVKEYIESFEYKLISKEYINNAELLKIECPEGHIFNMSFSSFKTGSRCPKCLGKQLNFKEVKDKIELTGYTLLSTEYKTAKDKLHMKCDKGHEFYMSLTKFNQGHRCLKCHNENGHNRKYNYEFVNKYVKNEGYKLLSNSYTIASEKLLMECDKGHRFFMSFRDFKDGTRCPQCNISKGEYKISKILEKYDIAYEIQYKFKDCRFYKELPFDFYLPKYNMLIEYDGEQHFKIVNWFGGFNGFINTKIRDTIKNIYCKENNIKLIRIPYWEFDNIETILNEKIINKDKLIPS